MIAPVATFTGIRPPQPKNTPKFGSQISNDTRLAALKEKYPVLNTMLDLIEVPSATPQTDLKFAPAVELEMNTMRARVEKHLLAAGVQQDWISHDPAGSLVVRIPASEGYENKKPLMLTAHMDIVAGDETDPTRTVKPQLDRDWITSDGTTTLGADDKGGLAMILDNVARVPGKHPLQQTPIPHAGLELIFSPDEESTLESLKNLDTSQLKAKHVLVVDEFDAFKVTTGLASAVPIKINVSGFPGGAASGQQAKLSVSGFPGGHSGDDIDKGRPNALFALFNAIGKLGGDVLSIKGGRAPNAIPESAQATVSLPEGTSASNAQAVMTHAQSYYAGHGAPNAQFSVELENQAAAASTQKASTANPVQALINALRKIGTGVIAMQPDNSMPVISKNTAIIKAGQGSDDVPRNAEVEIFLRSGNAAMQRAELARIQKLLANAQRYYRGHGVPNAKFEMQWHEEYPAWEGDPNTPLKGWAVKASEVMKESEPGTPKVEIGAVHAAAQASILANKTNADGEQFDAVLIGPQIEEAHTVRERTNWQTLLKANQWLGEIIRQYTNS